MIKKTITYTDLTGEKSEMTAYFHMNKAEVLKWLIPDGHLTLDQILLKFLEHKDVKELMNILEDLIRRSYGEKSMDGKSFVKSADKTEEFMQSEAYSELFISLLNNDEESAKFLNGVFPSELSGEVERTIKENPDIVPIELRGHLPKSK